MIRSSALYKSVNGIPLKTIENAIHPTVFLMVYRAALNGIPLNGISLNGIWTVQWYNYDRYRYRSIVKGIFCNGILTSSSIVI